MNEPAENSQPRGVIATVLAMFNLSRSEVPRALLAALMFFLLLCGYFFVRPVRESFGVERGMTALYSLFFATMIVSLALSPIFSWLVGRFDRRVFLPLSYGAIVVMMLGFAAFRALGGDEAITIWTGKVFFVWLSVVNLFMTGLFWSLMADSFGHESAKRVFPFVAVGGTLGALFGSAFAWAVAGGSFELFKTEWFRFGFKLSASQMMCLAAAFICAAGVVAMLISARSPRVEQAPLPRRSSLAEATDGIRLAVQSPYLAAIAGYIGLLGIVATVLYFMQNRLVLAAAGTESERVGLFASIDFFTQAATLLLQLVLTARLIRWIGVGWTMAILPIVVIAGVGLLMIGEWSGWSAAAMVVAVTVVQAIFRASKYAIARPTRETLFAVLTRNEKYKAKSLIDTFVYRAGDTAGAGVDALLTATAVATMTALAATVTPLAIVMAGLALYLGAARKRHN